MTAAVGLADRDGVPALSMRRLGQELGVDPMSLYTHVRDKDDLLDAVVDQVIAQIEPRLVPGDWAASLRGTLLSARAAMLRHPWAPRLVVERQAATPAALRHVDAVLGVLRGGGFPLELAHHALHVLGSRILGFDQSPFDDSTQPGAAPDPARVQAWVATLPHVAELALAATHDGALGACDDDEEFAFALDLILDGLERRRALAAGEPSRRP